MPAWAVPRTVGEVGQRAGWLRSESIETVDDVEEVLEFNVHGVASSLIGINS